MENLNEIKAENKTNLDLFEKYNTYYTFSLIISFLDEKSLYQLLPTKRRFYILIKDQLKTFTKNISLPMFNKNYICFDDLFITYYFFKNL